MQIMHLKSKNWGAKVRRNFSYMQKKMFFSQKNARMFACMQNL